MKGDGTRLSGRVLPRVLYAIIAICAAVLVIGDRQAAEHGLTRTLVRADAAPQTARWALPFIDGSLLYWDQPQTITLSGVLWQGGPGSATWRVAHSGGVTVRVDGEVVFAAPDYGPFHADEFPVTWAGDSLRIELVYNHDPAAVPLEGARLEIGLYERSWLGLWQVLPQHRLYTEAPDPTLAVRESRIHAVMQIALLALFVCAAWVIGLWAFRARIWRRREAWAIAALMALAFGVRLLVMAERASGSYDDYFYLLQQGSDNYVVRAWEYMGGAPVGGAYMQPGMALWLMLVMRVFGPGFWTLYLVDNVVAALGVGAVTGAGWLLFNRRAGLLAGLTVALFPPLVYYQTTVQPVALATSLTAFAALAGIWTVRRSSVRAACLFGLVIGLSGLVRPTLLLLGPALFLALLVSWRRRAGWGGLRRMVLLTGFAGLFALGAVLPQTVANYQVGMHALINGSSSVTLYVGNNRDADGSMSLRQAFYVAKARQLGWIDALQADLEADPLRMGELVLHKIGLFWSNVELYNNVDYYLYGLKFSPWLRLTSFNGWLGVSLLGILGFAGLAFLLLEGSPGRQEGAWLLIWGLVALTLGTAVYDMAGRLRALAFPLVAIGVGVTLDRGLAAVRARHRDRRLLTTILIGLVVMLVFQAFEYQFPRKRFLRGDLPAEVVTRYDNFNNEIRLVGALPVETDHRQGGYAYVTLYWQAIAPIQQDYYAFVHLVDLHGNKIAGKDLPAGAITYPDVKSSRWPVGAILAESYLIPLPPDAPPVMEVHVGLYEGETMTRLPLILPDGSPSAQDHIRLGAIGVATEAGFPTVDDPLEPVTYRLGDVLRLTGVYTPRQVAPGDSLAVSLQWEADGPVLDDYNVFIHMVNADRAMVTQHDGPALGADWPTSAMVPGQPFAVQHVLDVPADVPPGEYTLLVGLYSYPSLDRLPAYDGQGALLPDGAIDLARVQITTQAGGD